MSSWYALGSSRIHERNCLTFFFTRTYCANSKFIKTVRFEDFMVGNAINNIFCDITHCSPYIFIDVSSCLKMATSLVPKRPYMVTRLHDLISQKIVTYTLNI
jgi:hypothetical protein